jgi:hypothetical protein
MKTRRCVVISGGLTGHKNPRSGSLPDRRASRSENSLPAHIRTVKATPLTSRLSAPVVIGHGARLEQLHHGSRVAFPSILLSQSAGCCECPWVKMRGTRVERNDLWLRVGKPDNALRAYESAVPLLQRLTEIAPHHNGS